ncbi:MAG: hypothetical protein IPM37_03235 [Hahellaceae bacterium]|nr:hypothetical protein [Hahellaceae bacterium]
MPQLKARQRDHSKPGGKIGGQLHYDGETKQLQLVKPTLLDFRVSGRKCDAVCSSVDQLKTRLGYHLPIIILLDAQRLGPGAQYFTPSSISVVQNGVRSTFNFRAPDGISVQSTRNAERWARSVKLSAPLAAQTD